MLIDTSSIKTSGASNSGAKTSFFSAEMSRLISELGLAAGQKIDVTISKLTEITTEERNLLLALKAQNTDSPKARNTWQTLMNHPTLKHAELTLSQKLINVLTTAPLAKGETLKLLVTATGLQVISNDNELVNPNTTRKSQSLSNAQALSLYSNKTTPHSSIKQSFNLESNTIEIQNKIQTITTMSTRQIESLLKQTLTQALPNAQKHDGLFNIFEKLTSAISVLPKNEVTPQLNQLVKRLNLITQRHSLAVKPSSVPSNSELKEVITRSGTFYEQKIFNARTNPLLSQIPVSASKQSELKTPTVIASNSQPPAKLSQALHSIEPDLKGALIQLMQFLEQANLKPNIQIPNKTDDAIVKLWLNIFQIIAYKPEPRSSKSELKNLFQALQQQVQNSISRVQVQQFRTLTSQTQDPASTQGTIHIDIPIKTPDGYTNLFLQFWEPKQKEQEKTKETKKHSKKNAKWRVFMELEFDIEGTFAVEVTVCNKHMDATFWAEKESLRQKTEKNIVKLKQELEGKGLNVIDLRCSKSPPPKQKIHMDFSLIDERT